MKMERIIWLLCLTFGIAAAAGGLGYGVPIMNDDGGSGYGDASVTDDGSGSAGSDIADGDDLKVISILTPPFLMEKDNADTLKGNEKYEGFIVDLLDEIYALGVGKTYTISLVKDGKYGSKNENDEWNGIVAEVRAEGGKAIGAAPLTVTAARAEVIKFSTPWMTSGITFMMNRKDVFGETGLPYNLAYFLAPFSVGVWLLIIFVFLAVSGFMALVDRFDPYEYGGKRRRGTLKEGEDGSLNIRESLFFCLGAITFQGYYKPPLSYAARTMTAFWWVFCLITLATYVAALVHTASRAGSLQNPKYTAFEDLLYAPEDFRFGPLESGSTQAFLKKSRATKYRKAWERMTKYNNSFSSNKEEAVKRVKQGNYAFIGEFAMIDYVVARECDTVMVGGQLDTRSYAFAFEKDKSGDVPKKFDEAILKLGDTGKLNELHDKWWHTNQKCRNAKVNADGYTGLGNVLDGTGLPVTLDEFGGPLIVLLIGLLCAVIALVAEIVYYRLKGKGDNSRKKNLNETGDSTHPLEEKP